MSTLTVPVTLPVIPLAMTDLSAPKAARAFKWIGKDTHSLAKRILTDGLLNPILVRRSGSQMVVVDGLKRLAALKLLKRAGKLPRSLTRVPCIVTDEEVAAPVPAMPAVPILKTDAELARAINAALKSGLSHSAIAERFDCPAVTINYAASLVNLHPQIREYFNSGHIGMDQAAAFAGIENIDAQWRLLQELGPFAHASEVICAILAGQTVVDMPDGNVMIMPSRCTPSPKQRIAA